MKIFNPFVIAVACAALSGQAIAAQAASAPAATPAAVAAPAKPAAQPPANDAASVFKRWDTNKDGSLSTTEFASGWQQVQAANTLRALRDNFVAKDTDHNGSIGAAEYLNLELIKAAGPAAPALANFDTNKNQSLDFKEYVGMVTTLTKPVPPTTR